MNTYVFDVTTKYGDSRIYVLSLTNVTYSKIGFTNKFYTDSYVVEYSNINKD